MKYFVYILKSKIDNKYYIGSTGNIKNRLEAHNRGSVKSTKYRRPMELIYYEEYNDRTTTLKRERQIKGFKGGILFKKLLDNGRGVRVA